VAIRLIRKWGIEKETSPVFASAYCAAVHAAITTARIEKTATGWRFHRFGSCPTVRIDDEPREVDFEKSRGLLGARRRAGSLYLHLALPDAQVVLAERPEARPHVREANHALHGAELGPTGVAVTSEAVHSRLIVFAGFPPETELLVTIDGRKEPRKSDEDGRLRVELPVPGKNRVEARVP
jgi:hypothetical protein